MDPSPPPSPSPSTPRLRVSRSLMSVEMAGFNLSGPSRLLEEYLTLNHDSDDTNNDSTSDVHPTTPKLSVAAGLSSKDDLAAKLRAAMKGSKSSITTSSPNPDTPTIPQPSQSIAKESLKDLFSHALRDPDTPQKGKGRWRRNSIDSSEVENSPRVIRVQMERAGNKGKRKSLSDEEVDASHKSKSDPGSSTRSSSAATFDSLRGMLDNTRGPSNASLLAELVRKEAPHSEGTVTIVPDSLSSSQISSPIAASTPQQQSIHLLINTGDSDLLGHDSEMRQALLDQDSYDSVSVADEEVGTTTAKSITQTNLDRDDHSASTLRTKSGPTIKSRGSLRTSPISRRSFHVTETAPTASNTQRQLHGVNVLDPTPSSSRHTRNDSTMTSASITKRPIPRKGSTSSMQSASSTSSQNESGYQDRNPEYERIHQLERAWGRHRAVKPNASATTHHSPIERPRTRSQPDRPHISLNRTPSNATDTLSDGDDAEINHEREHNWNTPLPKRHNQRVTSPLPPPNESASKHPPAREDDDLEERHEQDRNWNSLHTKRHDVQPHRSGVVSPNFSRSSSTRPRVDSLTSLKISRHGSIPSAVHHEKSSTPPGSDEEEQSEVNHERERNWNAPHPKWHDHHHRSSHSTSPAPPHSRPPQLSPSSNRQRITSLTSPINGQRQHSVSGKAHTSSPSISVSPKPRPKSSSLTFASIRSRSLDPLGQMESSVKSTEPLAPGSKLSETGSRIPLRSVRKPVLNPKVTEDKETKGTITSSISGAWPADSDDIITDCNPHDMRNMAAAVPSQRIKIVDADQISSSSEITGVQQLEESTPTRSPFLSLPLERPQTSAEQLCPTTPIESVKAEVTKVLPLDLPSTDRGTSLKTPKPPGGWITAPARGGYDDSLTHDDSNMHNLPPTDKDLLVMKTPKPPGGWVTTPLRGDQSSSQKETQEPYSSQLVTPPPSLSRGSPLGSQATALPGGWMATPANQKNVRFGMVQPRQQISVDQESIHANHNTSLEHPSLPSTDSQLRSNKGVNIRVVDAFGRVEIQSQDVDTDDHDSHFTKINSGNEIPKLTREEAISRIRDGVSALARDIEDVVPIDSLSKEDVQRVNELNDISLAARRERVKLRLEQNGISKVKPIVRLALLKNKSLLLLGFITLCFTWLLAYRYSAMQARKIFLTTYYDPFYADLHLYSVKPSRTIRWYPILDLGGQDQSLEQGSVYSAIWGALEMIQVFISDLETALWSEWNRDIQNATSWPPT